MVTVLKIYSIPIKLFRLPIGTIYNILLQIKTKNKYL